MSIVLVGSTSGSCTLQEQAVAGTTVLTLPTTSGTILTTASSGQSIPKAALPTGSVLQVVQAVSSAQQATTSNTYTDISFFSVSITPNFATSKILAIVNVNGVYSGQLLTGLQTRLRRDSTDIAFGSCYGSYHGGATDAEVGSVVMQILDSPATTSAITYKVQFRTRTAGNSVIVNLNDSGNVQINDASTNSAITLMEIAA
jgi:hypothetical protein